MVTKENKVSQDSKLRDYELVVIISPEVADESLDGDKPDPGYSLPPFGTRTGCPTVLSSLREVAKRVADGERVVNAGKSLGGETMGANWRFLRAFFFWRALLRGPRILGGLLLRRQEGRIVRRVIRRRLF